MSLKEILQPDHPSSWLLTTILYIMASMNILFIYTCIVTIGGGLFSFVGTIILIVVLIVIYFKESRKVAKRYS